MQGQVKTIVRTVKATSVSGPASTVPTAGGDPPAATRAPVLDSSDQPARGGVYLVHCSLEKAIIIIIAL